MHSSLNKNNLNSDFGEKTLPHINHLLTYAVLITGDESKAEKVLMKTYAEAFNKDKEFYSFIRSMEAYRETLATPETRLLLSPNSEFFKYFAPPVAP
ncbi:MAG: hypothetical protein IH795_02975 [Bacteroidetes bacterium]|nr:hypothetical protein [Bacteroidota bacterium]